jgi:hypothetical protein
MNLPTMTTTGACKPERLIGHRTDPSCTGCHTLLDPIGFGLETFDSTGRYRANEPGRSDCAIKGDGEISGLGTFNGPAQLSDLLLKDGRLDKCMMQNLYHFAVGRSQPSGDDTAPDALLDRFRHEGDKLDQFLLTFVSAPAFQFRWVE